MRFANCSMSTRRGPTNGEAGSQARRAGPTREEGEALVRQAGEAVFGAGPPEFVSSFVFPPSDVAAG